MHNYIALESEPDFRIHPLRIEFSNAETENKFQVHHLRRCQASLRTALIFCSFFYVAFALTDVGALGYSRATLLLLCARLLVALAAIIGLYLVRTRPESIMTWQAVATVVEIVGMGTYILIVHERPTEIPWHAMSMGIMLIVVYLFIPNRLIVSLSIALVATAGFIAIVAMLGTLQPYEMLTMLMLLLLTNSLGLVAARRQQRSWREEYRVHSSLTTLSVRDHLTGCFNRRYLNAALLPAELARAARHRLCLSIILCDIDNFKSINDTFGHLCGDMVLRNITTVLHTLTRRHVDSVIRYGGEEFLLLLPQTDRAGAVILAENLRRAITEASVVCDNRRIVATASFGVLAINFTEGSVPVTEDAIIAAADSLLYRAKKAGRNNVQSDDFFR